jgi:hypothetical protein
LLIATTLIQLNIYRSESRDGYKTIFVHKMEAVMFELKILVTPQPSANDCWATCSYMVLQWQSVVCTIDSIKTFMIGKNNYAHGEMATILEARFAMKKISDGKVVFSVIKSAMDKCTITMGDCIKYLNESRPIMISTKNHMMLIIGYEGESKLRIIDPSGGKKGSMEFSTLADMLVEAAVMN